jgi:enoyl-CoA hydratase/carnithine racemase
MDTYLKVSVANNIGEVVLNRPKKLNIMDETFFKVFHEAVLKLVNDPDVRVILVHAEGPVFTAGLDLKSTAAVLNPRMYYNRMMVLPFRVLTCI